MMATKETDPLASYLSRQILLLKIVLMWPVEVRGIMKIFTFIYFWSVVFSLSVSTSGLLSKVFVTKDLVERSEAIHIFTLTSSGLYKFLYFIAHRNTLLKLSNYINENFLEKPIYSDECLTMKSWMKVTTILSTFHCSIAFVIITFWGFCPIIKYMSGLIPFSDISLPINVYYPYDFNHGFQFIPLYMLHYFILIVIVQIYMAIDGYFFSMIHFACGQIEIIKASLRGIETISLLGLDAEKDQHRGLIKSIDHHNKVLKFIKELEVLFRPMIGVDVLHSVVALSFSMLQATESRGIFESVKLYLFVMYSFLHQYLNSLFGQMLINQQENLLTQMYSINWEKKAVSFRRSTYVMMACSLTPLKFSAWRMYFLQYETLVDFVRVMFSFYTVLRNLRDH